MKKFMPIFALLAIFILGGIAYNFTKQKQGNIIENTATTSVSNENENLEKLKMLNEKSKEILAKNSVNSANSQKQSHLATKHFPRANFRPYFR